MVLHPLRRLASTLSLSLALQALSLTSLCRQVSLLIGVSLRAVSLPGMVVCSVADLIQCIFGVVAPVQVIYSIVGSVPVSVEC